MKSVGFKIAVFVAVIALIYYFNDPNMKPMVEASLAKLLNKIKAFDKDYKKETTTTEATAKVAEVATPIAATAKIDTTGLDQMLRTSMIATDEITDNIIPFVAETEIYPNEQA